MLAYRMCTETLAIVVRHSTFGRHLSTYQDGGKVWGKNKRCYWWWNIGSHWFKAVAKTRFPQETESLDRLVSKWVQGREKGQDSGRAEEWSSCSYWLKGLKSWSGEVPSRSQAERDRNVGRTDWGCGGCEQHILGSQCRRRREDKS